MRPNLDRYMLSLAQEVSTRSTCIRRNVGCVLVNEEGKILATGYNGVPAGWAHCNENKPCPGALEPSGTGLDLCEAIHAEQNALLQCADVQQIFTAYITTSPCVTCTKLLINTSCSHIMFGEEYSQPSAKQLWKKTGLTWRMV